MELEERLRALEARVSLRRERHRQDVAHVQAEHPEMAQWLAEMTRAFGRCDYRVTLRHTGETTCEAQ